MVPRARVVLGPGNTMLSTCVGGDTQWNGVENRLWMETLINASVSFSTRSCGVRNALL
jgi:hypothetical protein